VPDDVALGNDALGGGSSRVVQTFYIESPQPNVVFAAASTREVYFPAAGLRVDPAGSIRSPIELDSGLVYSVVSEVPSPSPSVLRRARRTVPDGMAPYLQLEEGLPGRVGDLARAVTAGRTTWYDAVVAVQAWLRANTRYDLDVPRDPDGVDAVDHFLFETRRGYCEQIASSIAVMLRTLGIPARLVTGYGPGERNPLTGYFEVKQSDAHAWVEVFYPGIGWVPYDPTFGVPQAAPGIAGRFMAGPVFAAVGRFAREVVPAPLKSAAAGVGRSVAAAGALALRVWPVALVLLAFTGLGLALARRSHRRSRARPSTPGEEAFLGIVEALGPLGHSRSPQETPSEFLDSVVDDETLDAGVIAAAEIVVRTFERERFAPVKPGAAELGLARAAADRVRTLVGRR
jgi:hypothetical protein